MKYSIRNLIVCGVLAGLGFLHFSCTLNPLNGLLTSLNVRIISAPSLASRSVAVLQPQVAATVPTAVPTKASDFDCLAFSVTGYGIDEKVDSPTSEIPLASLRLGAETSMQSPAANPSLNFEIQIPSLLGVDARLQKRLVQIYGVYSSLSNKTLCRGRSLSDFLVNTDPLAAVYLVGSAYYPSDSAGCGDGELCIDDVISRTGAGTELIYQNLFQEPIQPEIAFSTSNELSGLTLFSASDFDTHGSEKNVNSVNSKPFFDNRIARVDLYFPFSRYKMNRAVSGQLDVPTLQATNYNVVTSSCGASLGTYADVQIKIWDTANSTWMNPPVNGSTFDVIKVAANGSYTLNFIDLADESVQPLSVNGRDYLIFSLRSQNTSCSSLNVNFPSLSFY